MNVNEIISKINTINLQSEEDLQEVESVLTEMDNALIEPLFRLLERHPHFNFGNPGRVVHYLEKLDNNTYAPFLYASIRRVPTEYNIWMLNRFLNSLDTSEKSEGIVILEETLQKDIDEGLREWVIECLDEQKEE